jgi:hypothetical protein
MRGSMHAFLSSALLVTVLVSAGCGVSKPETAEPEKPEQAAGASSPEETIRAYVAGINGRDGAAVCALLLDSAAYEFRIPDWGECPKVVSGYIGYAEDNPDDRFHRAAIVAMDRGETKGELLRINVQFEVERDEGRARETLDDVIWLVLQDGRWRLAKASGLLYAAFGAYQVPDDLFEAPDLSAQEARYQEALESEREQQKAEQATFTQPEEGVLTCGGIESAYDDASHDLHIEGDRELTRAESERYATADVRRVEVDVEGDDICARFTLADNEVGELLLIRFDIYSPEKDPTFLGPALELRLEVQADGRARLAYEDIHVEEDEYGRHPVVPVPGRVAHEGNVFSLRANRRDLLEVMRDRELPPWNGFLWGGITFYVARFDGDRRAVSDDVHAYLARVSHPGGRVFGSEERMHYDLPTD